LVGHWLGWIEESWPLILIVQWLPAHTEDLVPLFPWLGIMLLGLGVAGVFPLNKISLKHRPINHYVTIMGRHGLLIYLLHQPILFAGFMLVA
jgi:uncharacterized membrane protein